MRLCLQTCFDVGVSFGLGDEVFRASAATQVPDILNVGIRNPLGLGVAVDLVEAYPAIVRLWTEAAKRKVYVPEMEIGFSPSPGGDPERELGAFQAELTRLLDSHPVTGCALTIYAIGTAFLSLELGAGIPLPYVQGFYKCYEFAGYEPGLADELRRAALETVGRAVQDSSPGLQQLSRRPEPAIEVDERGTAESRLISSFTRIALCIDPGDDLPAILRVMLPPLPGEPEPVVEERIVFEYHGILHFDWAACILEPRAPGLAPEAARSEMARMLLCIQIAHVFLGTCEAFERLFLHQTFRQVDRHLQGREGGLNARDLNRLRTLALAVVSLTSFAAVTETDEDQAYFACFDRHARLAARHALIQNRCDILYNVEVAETQAEESERQAEDARRQRRLSIVVQALTGLTVISVAADAYNFVREGEQHLIPDFVLRLILLSALGLLILVVVLALSDVFRWRWRRGRPADRSRR